MLDERDRRWLERSAGRDGAVREGVVVAVAILLVILGALNLALAAKLGSLQGYSLADLLNGWFTGVQADRQYSGEYFLALDRLTMSVLWWGTGLAAGILAAGKRFERRRARRILAVLQERDAF